MEIIHAALPQIKDPVHRTEIERYLASRGQGSLPSPAALEALEGALIAVLMMSQKESRR